MKKYQEYKDSGIEWIGEIPKHWERSRLKHIVSIKITDGPHETPTFYEQGIPFLSAEAININKLDFDKIRGYISAEQCEIYNKKCKVEKNDILFCKSGSTTGKSALVETDTEFAIWSPLAIIRARKEQFHYNYVFYAIQSLSFRTQVEIFWSFGTQPNIGMNVLENLWIPVPPFEIQIDIANFLRKKISLIDSAIQKKRQMIELLKEERAAIINQAVTKGINPDAEMKNSGIEWLGEVPKHWEVKRLKHISEVISKGTTPSTIGGEISEQGNIKFIKAENIVDNYLADEPAFRITEETDELLKRSRLKNGDVLIVIAGATIGKVAIVTEKHVPSNTNQAVCFIRPKLTKHSKLLWYWLQTSFIRQIISLDSVQAAQPNLSMERIGNFPLLIPECTELLDIIEYIDNRTKYIDNIIVRYEKEISLIEEYRTALINEAVTGKIDVRESV